MRCGILGIIIVGLSLLRPNFARAEAPATAPRCEFGVEGPMPREGMNPGELPIFLDAVADLGAEFIVASFTPEWNSELARKRGNYVGSEGTVEAYREFADLCRRRKLGFFINQQITSYCKEGEFLDKAGKDILAHGDGTHRWDVSGELLATLSRMPEFRGVVYDEAEWNILRRDRNTNGGDDNASSGRIHPYFAVTENLNVFDAYEATVRGAEPVAEAYRKAGVRMMGEHVFPVMFHAFARAGINPCTKFMKEGRDSVYGAIAMGAALQYDRDFCVSPDMWGLASMGVSRSGFPGHPPEELRCSLLLAYWMGASRVFVENIYADFLAVGAYKTSATGLLDRVVRDGKAQYMPSKYGEAYRWFVKEYVPSHPLPYSFRDCRPDMAIIRFDDSYWGQRGGFTARNLYGGVDMPGPASKAWIGLWHLLTHGQTSAQGLSYHNGGWPRRHDFFTALNNVVVYDDRVGKERLRGLKVAFLTGLRVSDETRQAIAELVHDEGLICISQQSLAPPAIAAEAGSGPMTDGKGKWLITEDFDTAEVRELAGPWLGKPDEIRYRFGANVVTITRKGDDNSIEIRLTPSGPSAWSAPPPSTLERKPISVDELHLLEPFWNSEIVYREGLFFVQEDAEHPPAASLLFVPAEVISLHSATGETTYELGKDYVVQAESRRILLTKDSRIPFKKREELYRTKGQSHAIGYKTGDPATLLYFGEGHFFHDQQAEITYRRGGEPWQGFAPKLATNKLPRTLAALKARRPLNICLTGDSIAEGGNASGSRGVPPYAPPFGELFALGLERAFDTKITLKNLAVGGKTADHGVQTAADIAATKPDLVLIAYGMNDVGRRDPVRYRTSIEQIMGRVRESNPETEFILVAPMLANPEWQATPAEMFPKYRDALALLCGQGVALADVTALWTDVLKRKHYHDLTGNGVNHTNDFGHRLYAQVILGLLVERSPFVNNAPSN